MDRILRPSGRNEGPTSPRRVVRQHTVTIDGMQAEGELETVPIIRTQQDQNQADAAARQKATKELVRSWMDRLQLISVITTFFASTEAGLLQITTPDPDAKNDASVSEQIANATLLGALVVHVFAAIISFLAAFFLVRYEVHQANDQELKAEGAEMTQSPISTTFPDQEQAAEQRSNSSPTPPLQNFFSTSEAPIYSRDPHLELAVGRFTRKPPTHLLSRCHSLCIALAAFGFVLAVAGIVCFAWARHPIGVSVFSSACAGVCLIAGVAVLV